MEKNNLNIATFANGCFWCTEAVFNRVVGVEQVVSGFTGGHIKNPAYREITTGRTGHAEAIQLYYNSNKISYIELLEIFFATHDPTTLNRQGHDIGTQYRSAIFYHNEEQKHQAEAFIKHLDSEQIFDDTIVTEVTAFDVFYRAEQEHHEFYERNKENSYCQFVIHPKLKKLNTYYSNKLKPTT
ncbi:peptide-methionine (S)-S-oxide reductase [Lacinutrix venerupis]|uniref:Peptide methionine sulfoxide reductase MsrA n=1 Tax=Lacinutrix venerupis TaxID=1486034 RepID=A0AAC9PVV3_9FLAO|nr:peptide-methionine (S)-S-oxide reductase MsrA [Lacinutrix venerupis]APY00082.1 peptide-methionine (S)-S-oxide reductase [Lacinutrix venerupis]RLJ69098.1 peptide-methionine (S)-S-oxide reductase [Lacinutrix venerupis]